MNISVPVSKDHLVDEKLLFCCSLKESRHVFLDTLEIPNQGQLSTTVLYYDMSRQLFYRDPEELQDFPSNYVVVALSMYQKLVIIDVVHV